MAEGGRYIQIPGGRYSWWQGDDGRWYWHRRAGGHTTDDGSYKRESSCRRAVLKRARRELRT